MSDLITANAHLAVWGLAALTRDTLMTTDFAVIAYDDAALNAQVRLDWRTRVHLFPGAFVVYDPSGDAEAWMLVGDDLGELVQESLTHHEEVRGEGGDGGNAAPYFPAHLRSDDEPAQHWTEQVDRDADTLFRTLTEADIRKRQDICQAQAKLAFEQKHDRAALDIARQDEALMREMLRRC